MFEPTIVKESGDIAYAREKHERRSSFDAVPEKPVDDIINNTGSGLVRFLHQSFLVDNTDDGH